MADKEKELVELDAKEVDSDIEKEGVDIDSNTPKPKEEQKVELDLDDAPFLEEEEDEEKEPEKEEKVDEEIEEEKETEEEKEEPPKKKKKIILIAIIALVGLLCVALIFFFIRGGKKEEEKKKLPPKSVAVKEKPPPPKPKTFQLALRPFWIDYKIKNGHRYLHLSLLVEYTDGRLNWEFRRKGIVIRDAIYYYLKNKDFSFFLDKRNLSVLKKEIMTIIDQYLVYGKIKRIYLQNYLIE